MGYKTTKKKLSLIFGKECMLTGNANVSVHHIKPKREKGNNKIENCILLSRDVHILLHFIENYDVECVNLINSSFKLIKNLDYRDRKIFGNMIAHFILEKAADIKNCKNSHPILVRHFGYESISTESNSPLCNIIENMESTTSRYEIFNLNVQLKKEILYVPFFEEESVPIYRENFVVFDSKKKYAYSKKI